MGVSVGSGVGITVGVGFAARYADSSAVTSNVPIHASPIAIQMRIAPRRRHRDQGRQPRRHYALPFHLLTQKIFLSSVHERHLRYWFYADRGLTCLNFQVPLKIILITLMELKVTCKTIDVISDRVFS